MHARQSRALELEALAAQRQDRALVLEVESSRGLRTTPERGAPQQRQACDMEAFEAQVPAAQHPLEAALEAPPAPKRDRDPAPEALEAQRPAAQSTPGVEDVFTEVALDKLPLEQLEEAPCVENEAEALPVQMPAAQNATKAITEALARQMPAALLVQLPADLKQDRAFEPERLVVQRPAAQDAVHVADEAYEAFAPDALAMQVLVAESEVEDLAAQMPAAQRAVQVGTEAYDWGEYDLEDELSEALGN